MDTNGHLESSERRAPVAQIFNLPYRRVTLCCVVTSPWFSWLLRLQPTATYTHSARSQRPHSSGGLADCKSAIQQTASLRYRVPYRRVALCCASDDPGFSWFLRVQPTVTFVCPVRSQRPLSSSGLADCKSAIQQTASLRYRVAAPHEANIAQLPIP